jgi:hypothetical protein
MTHESTLNAYFRQRWPGQQSPNPVVSIDWGDMPESFSYSVANGLPSEIQAEMEQVLDFYFRNWRLPDDAERPGDHRCQPTACPARRR